MIVDYKKRELCAQDYSEWLSNIPSQLGWSIEQGNEIFEKLQKKALKKISKIRNVDLTELKKYLI